MSSFGLILMAQPTSSSRAILKLQRELELATTYERWLDCAQELDHLEGLEAWRDDPRSPHYDHQLIQDHLTRLRALKRAQDWIGLRDLLEETLHRHLGDLGNPALYAYSYVGTKRLITEYLDELEQTLHWLCDAPLPGYRDERKLAMAREALRIFGRSALILSGGGALGLFHLGVVKALWHRQLLPEVLSGASMGAIVAGGVCTRDDHELAHMWEHIDEIHRRATRVLPPWRWLEHGSVLAPDQLREHVEANLRDMTFKEAHEHSGRLLNIAVSPVRRRQKPRLLNALTAPDVLITHATVASCSLPALFPPAMLWRRDPEGGLKPYMGGERWVDGSIHGDVPTQRLSRLHNINHHIVSQANPHVLPFATMEGGEGFWPLAADLATSALRAQSRQALRLARRRVHSALWLPSLEWAHAMTHQNYLGDITVYPKLRLSDYARVMKNPDLEELREYILSGERATWPKLAMIHDQTRISRAMTRSIERLQARLATPRAPDQPQAQRG